MGYLFYRGVSPLEIENMPFSRLAYWAEWHKVIAEAERPKI